MSRKVVIQFSGTIECRDDEVEMFLEGHRQKTLSYFLDQGVPLGSLELYSFRDVMEEGRIRQLSYTLKMKEQ
jgi:hypothetical protein